MRDTQSHWSRIKTTNVAFHMVVRKTCFPIQVIFTRFENLKNEAEINNKVAHEI